jgi:c-di-GMP-binding flagellar brake protein YcgR
MAPERRDFVKISVDIPVRFKFLSKTIEVKDPDVHEGSTSNISGSGLVLVTKIPDGDSLTHLLTNELVVGLNILLPSQNEAIKALAKLSYVEALPEMPGKCGLSLRFLDMPKESSDQILRYTIRAQITKKVKRGEIP